MCRFTWTVTTRAALSRSVPFRTSLVDAPNKEAIQKAHDEAHWGVANEIIEVDPRCQRDHRSRSRSG